MYSVVVRLSYSVLAELLYNRSGLLGVAGISDDGQVLLESAEPRAAETTDLHGYRIARAQLSERLTLDPAEWV